MVGYWKAKTRRNAMRKYLATPKGQAARRRAQARYNQSEKGRRARANYLASAKGREAVRAHRTKKNILGSVTVTA